MRQCELAGELVWHWHLAGAWVMLVDGYTGKMPVPPQRGNQPQMPLLERAVVEHEELLVEVGFAACGPGQGG